VKKAVDQANHYGKQDAQQNHGHDGKVKPEVFAFDADITRQPADPVQLVVEEINENTSQYDSQANKNNPLTRF
jgi:hypothetical protein